MEGIKKYWDSLKWEEYQSTIKSFRLGEEPEVIHVIKTGFADKYMVVHEEIENKFKIKL
jgi:hypothetical protein